MCAVTTASAPPGGRSSPWPVGPGCVAPGGRRPSQRGADLLGHRGGARGFPRRPPGAAPLHTVFRRGEREAGEAPLGAWAEGLRGEAPRLAEVAAAMASAGKP